jgi:hypothetical protein
MVKRLATCGAFVYRVGATIYSTAGCVMDLTEILRSIFPIFNDDMVSQYSRPALRPFFYIPICLN